MGSKLFLRFSSFPQVCYMYLFLAKYNYWTEPVMFKRTIIFFYKVVESLTQITWLIIVDVIIGFTQIKVMFCELYSELCHHIKIHVNEFESILHYSTHIYIIYIILIYCQIKYVTVRDSLWNIFMSIASAYLRAFHYWCSWCRCFTTSKIMFCEVYFTHNSVRWIK